MSVYDVAHRLARELKKSEEYKSYLKVKEKIKNNSKTKEMLMDFQKEQFKLQSKAISGQEVTEEEKKKLNSIMEIVKLNNDIQKYLDIEYRISIMLNDIQEIVFADLDIGIKENEKEEEEGNKV